MPKPVLLLLGLRALGALALLAIAADHLYEYYADHYSAIPTIGTLFLLNGAGATALALILLAPSTRSCRLRLRAGPSYSAPWAGLLSPRPRSRLCSSQKPSRCLGSWKWATGR